MRYTSEQLELVQIIHIIKVTCFQLVLSVASPTPLSLLSQLGSQSRNFCWLFQVSSRKLWRRLTTSYHFISNLQFSTVTWNHESPSPGDLQRNTTQSNRVTTLQMSPSGLWRRVAHCGGISMFRRTLVPPSSGCPHLHPEDGGSMILRNVGILPQHCTPSQHRRPRPETLTKPHSLNPEDRGSKVFPNVGILLHHYTASQPRRPRLESLSPTYFTLKMEAARSFETLVSRRERTLWNRVLLEKLLVTQLV